MRLYQFRKFRNKTCQYRMPESSHQHNDDAGRVKFLRQNKIIEISSCFSHILYAKWNFPKFNSTIASKCNCSASVLISVNVFVFVHKLFPKLRSSGCHLINLLKKTEKRRKKKATWRSHLSICGPSSLILGAVGVFTRIHCSMRVRFSMFFLPSLLRHSR